MNVIIVPLTKIINYCIRESTFPEVLKLSKVIPIFKKGAIDNPSNYRPISLIPTLGKIFESLLKTQICNHFEDLSLFNKSQYGFRNNCSTTMALNKLSDIIFGAFANKEHAYAMCLDLSKAFDCVPYELLLEKLCFYGFDYASIQLLKSYLTNRTQFVNYNYKNSEVRTLHYGVPQGSVLGPVLFIIYINDLPRSSRYTNYILFADDTTLSGSNSDFNTLKDQVKMNAAEVEKWFLCNRLSLNTDKTQTLYFSLRDLDENADSITLLGVTLDKKMTWEAHVNKVVNVICQKMYLIRRLVSTVSIGTLKTAYFGIIHSRLCYAILVWGHSAHLQKLFSIQRRCVRIMAGLKYQEDCRDHFKRLKIMTLPSVYIFNCLMYVKRNYNEFKVLDHTYDTRHKHLLLPEFQRLSTTRNSLRYMCSMFFNILPKNIQESNLQNFNIYVKNLLVENSFYSTQEFIVFDFTTLK